MAAEDLNSANASAVALDVLRHAHAGTTDTHRPSSPASARAASGRVAVLPSDPQLLTQVYQRVLVQRTSAGGQR